MTIYAILCGQTDYANIAYFMKIKEEYFNELLGLENGTPSHDCLSDLYAQIDIERLEEVIRDHWNIECGLHWRLDVILDEDHSRNRIGNSINNLSILRKIVFNLASLDDSFGKVPLKRKLTNYVLDFSKIERLIFEIISSINDCQ